MEVEITGDLSKGDSFTFGNVKVLASQMTEREYECTLVRSMYV